MLRNEGRYVTLSFYPVGPLAEVLFYHLEQSSLDHVLPGLLEKTLQRGWRATIRASDAAMVEKLDGHLWTYDSESFLPHAAAGTPADNPLWLTCEMDLPNTPDLLFVVDGASLSLEELEGLTRCVLIFDGADSAQLEQARSYWKLLEQSPHQATYWRQNKQGRWEKAA